MVNLFLEEGLSVASLKERLRNVGIEDEAFVDFYLDRLPESYRGKDVRKEGDRWIASKEFITGYIGIPSHLAYTPQTELLVMKLLESGRRLTSDSRQRRIKFARAAQSLS